MRPLLALLMLLAALGAPGAARAADEAPAPAEARLRGWYLGLQWSAGARDRWDVFSRDGLPPADVEDVGRGFGVQLGHRFGGRFLLGLDFAARQHDLAGLPEKLYDVEALVAGTVLWNESGTLQPFVRGGLGGGAVAIDRASGDGHVIAIGTAAVAGGGLQVRLGAGFALEVQAALNVTNVLEVRDQDNDGTTDDDWKVKASQVGWRTGVGFVVWF